MKRIGRHIFQEAALVATTTIQVRFSEVDSMKVVWHGEYVRYFEDGREAFGRSYPGIGYLDIYEAGYTAPVVDMELHYLRPLSLNEQATVEVRYLKTEAAKLCFEYIVRRSSDGEVAAYGSTTQVFVDGAGDLSLNSPAFYENWKQKWLSE